MPPKAIPTAESLAELCLAHLAADPELLAGFMGTSGYSPDGLRQALGTDGLVHGLIDYFAQNEALLVQLCADNGLRPEDFMMAWGRLNPAS